MDRRGGSPQGAVARQAFRAGAAVMLIVPGLLTTAFGAVLLLPPVQRMVLERMKTRLKTRMKTKVAAGVAAGVAAHAADLRAHRAEARDTPADVVEGTYTEIPADVSPGHRRRDAPSPWNDPG
jgi:UPF0716 family protein affecting phage T7 exclusion